MKTSMGVKVGKCVVSMAHVVSVVGLGLVLVVAVVGGI